MVDGQMSSKGILWCGVPQGTILGPLLFLIYINDLPACLAFSCAQMYADDTNFTIAGSCSNEIELKMNRDLENIRQWLYANR